MTDIVISEFLDEAALNEIPASLSVHYAPDLVDDRAELKRQIADVPALIVRSYVEVDDDLLAAGSRLKVVGRLGVGPHAGEELNTELHGPSYISQADTFRAAETRPSSPQRPGVAYRTY